METLIKLRKIKWLPICRDINHDWMLDANKSYFMFCGDFEGWVMDWKSLPDTIWLKISDKPSPQAYKCRLFANADSTIGIYFGGELHIVDTFDGPYEFAKAFLKKSGKTHFYLSIVY